MLSLEIEEWLSAEEITIPELRATWARLSVSVNGEVVSRCDDREARSVRQAVYLPLYPLAEWIATRWFPLLWETEAPGKREGRGFRQRHSIRSAAEGFALPDLEIVSEGNTALLTWKPLDLPQAGIAFLTAGESRCERDELEQALRGFVETVLRRLDDTAPQHRTLLHEEWEGIRSLDSSEREFCKVSALLGLDPFSLTSSVECQITEAHETIPESIRDDFFGAAPLHRLEEHLDWVRQGLSQTRGACDLADTLSPLRSHAISSLQQAADMNPWEQGYACARRMRQYLNLNGKPLQDREFDERLGFALARFEPVPQLGFDALAVRESQGGEGGIVLSARLPASRRFAYARSLFEYLTNPAPQCLITKAVTNGQKRNRAFAAELLAPADAIRQRLAGGLISQEEVEELAEEFRVSSFVIEHQIENHALGLISRA